MLRTSTLSNKRFTLARNHLLKDGKDASNDEACPTVQILENVTDPLLKSA
jgi:hypothetical protein